MDDIYEQITNQFEFLKDLGLTFDYCETNGKLGDRVLKKFTYNNHLTKKRIEFVYCVLENYQRLYGYLVNYNLTSDDSIEIHNNLSFDRLKCFFDEGEEIIFFGNKQFELKYKLYEYKLITERFIPYVITDRWVDYNELIENIKKVYTVALETTDYNGWISQIKSDEFIRNVLSVTFDSSKEPVYETYGLRLSSKDGIQFHISHGYKSRDDDGFDIKVFYPDKKTETYEFLNAGTDKVIQFIKQMVST